MRTSLFLAGLSLLLPAFARAQSELQILDGPLTASPSSFGSALAIDGDTALVGAPCWTDLARGTVHVLQRTPQGWLRVGELAVAGRPADAVYGFEVALAGDLALVGSGGDATYVFERQGASWTRTARLPRIGRLAVAASQILVGTAEPSLFFQGEVHVFGRTLAGWSETQVLTAPAPRGQDSFAHDLALSGNRLLVAQPNAATVHEFERIDGVWTPGATILTPPEAVGFGLAVDLDGTRALVGAMNGPFVGPMQGAYLYERDAGGWNLVQHLLPHGTNEDEGLLAVALAGDFALIGQQTSDVRIQPEVRRDAGASWLFVRKPSGWVEAGTLGAPTPETRDSYGAALALAADGTALIGVPGAHASHGEVHAWQLAASGCASLRASAESVSLFAGGSLRLELQAPQATAGALYLVLGSENGTAPGTQLGAGLRLPLNPGVVFTQMRRSANTGPFVDTLGRLDASAAARASIVFPRRSDASLVGLHLDFAFLTARVGATGLVLDGASNAVGLQLLP